MFGKFLINTLYSHSFIMLGPTNDARNETELTHDLADLAALQLKMTDI